jgi:predicted HTH domain antitoxin
MILIEDSILEAANMSEQELKVELAVMLYAQKRISFGQARKLAGMGYFEFEKQLFDRNIPAHYDVEEFEEDLKTIEMMRRGSRQ